LISLTKTQRVTTKTVAKMAIVSRLSFDFHMPMVLLLRRLLDRLDRPREDERLRADEPLADEERADFEGGMRASAINHTNSKGTKEIRTIGTKQPFALMDYC